MAERDQIRYGWHPNEGPHYPDGPGRAHVFHAECAPSLPWLDCVADVSTAASIDGKGHPRCERCLALFPHAVARV